MQNINHPGNLAPALDREIWTEVVPRDALKPACSRTVDDGEPVLHMDAGGRSACYGKWSARLDGIMAGQDYSFRVDYLPDQVEDEWMSIYAMLTWLDQDGHWLSRDYADDGVLLQDQWRQLGKNMTAPERATGLVIELVLRWSDHGSVTWRRPVVKRCPGIRERHGSSTDPSDPDPVARRSVTIASTFLKGRRNLDGNLQAMLTLLDRLVADAPDLVVFSETFYDRGIYAPQTIPGPLTHAVAARARRLSSYIVLCMNEKDGDLFYNTAVLIDRQGDIVGKYRKTHLPLIEAEEGVTPGDDLPVFETDFGKIGILICWDQCFPEAARILRLQGAEMIVISTIGDAPVQSLARAADNGIHVVVAGDDGPRPSRIINPLGEIIADIDRTQDGYCLAKVNLAKPWYVHWLSVGDADGEPRSLYLKERRTDLYRKYLK